MKNYRFLETICGLLCIFVACVFIIYIYKLTTNNATNMNGYTVKAKFNNVGTLHLGASVYINGIQVGNVYSIKLSLTDYKVEVGIRMLNDLQIPIDSIASVESEGFLGKNCIKIYPNIKNKDIKYIQKNQYINTTKDWESIEDKIGSFFFK